MYNKTCLGIFREVYLNPGIHKRELSKQLKLGMPSIDYAIKKINGLLKEEKSRNRISYFLDYSKFELNAVLYSVEHERFSKLPLKIQTGFKSFINDLFDKPLIGIIFGSYAKGNYDKDSDLDVLLVYSFLKNEKNIENTAKKISMETGVKISPIYLDYKSFKESFHDSTKAFFKNLQKNKIILLGLEWWRQLKNEEA